MRCIAVRCGAARRRDACAIFAATGHAALRRSIAHHAAYVSIRLHDASKTTGDVARRSVLHRSVTQCTASAVNEP